MKYEYIGTLGASVAGDSQNLCVPKILSDLCFGLLPVFRFSPAFVAVENNILAAVIIFTDFIRKDKLLAVFRLYCLRKADTIVRICKDELGILQHKCRIIEPCPASPFSCFCFQPIGIKDLSKELRSRDHAGILNHFYSFI